MASKPQASAPPSPALVFDTLMAYQRSAALTAAIDLDVFRGIGEGLGDVPSLARFCEASERGIRILCDYLTVIGLLGKVDGRYVHSPTSAAFLDPQSPTNVAAAARFLADPQMHEPFRRLADIVRHGRTTLPGEGTVEPENPVWVNFAHSMAPMMAPMAAPLGQIVLAGAAGPMRVLDIAAGHGLFGIEIARQNPQAEIVALDWAPVLAVARANAEQAGVASRFRQLPGSAFEVDYGGPYEVVLLTNFLHHFGRDTCVSLLSKVFAATAAGGRVAALEFVPNEDRVSPPMAAAFSLTMLADTVEGDAWTFSELREMFEAAGLRDVSAHPVPTGPHTVVMGVRP